MNKEYVMKVVRMSMAVLIAALLIFSPLMSGDVVRGQGGSGERTPTKTKPPAKTKTSAKPKTTVKRTSPSTSRNPAGGKKPAATNSSNSEQVFWESIRNSSDPEDFRDYLNRYPTGQFAGLARRRLNALTNNTAATPTNTGSSTTARTTTTGSRRPPFTNSVGIEFVDVPAGSFMMGSESSNQSDEKPVHRVTVGNGFYMGKYEVTQRQWQAVMGTNPSNFKGDNLPVEMVSWDDAQEFIRKLNARGDGYTYRLPSEAEWEYACRAGTTGDYAGNIDEMAWYDKNSGGRTHEVGSKQANAWGLYDMHGNVYEWCEDWYHESYNGAPSDGSARVSGGGQYRVLRGGSWSNLANDLRSAYRTDLTPDSRFYSYGFRLVAVART